MLAISSSLVDPGMDNPSRFTMPSLDNQTNPKSSESRMTLETIISVGVLGWLAMGIVLMGLGIW